MANSNLYSTEKQVVEKTVEKTVDVATEAAAKGKVAAEKVKEVGEAAKDAVVDAYGVLQAQVPLAFRFGVLFFVGGVVPNPLDIRFQKVSGLSATVETSPLKEGGQNLYTQKLPMGITYENLVLERGMVIGSPLHLEINATLSLFKFAPSNVMVSLFNEKMIPIAAWMFFKAYPVKWSTSDLNASQKEILVDHIELAYARMQIMRI